MLIIFDLDGTLVNAYPAVEASVNATLKHLGFPSKSAYEIKRSVGWGDRHLMAHFVGESLADRAIRFYRPHHTKALKDGVRFLPGAKNLLLRLKKNGHILAIASNRPFRFTRIILKELGVYDLFTVVLCADQVKRPKPAPDMIVEILRRTKFKRRDAMMVGDMTIDMNTGQRARVMTVGVPSGSSTKEELKQLKPHAVIDKIALLNTVIERKLR